MKIHWGSGIAIFYGLFVLVMIGMVIMSSRQEINMVQDNYYDKDLNYESFRKSRENASTSSHLVEINYQNGSELILVFPPELSVEEGEVLLYRPSDQRQDKFFQLSLNDQNKMDISTDGLVSGPWRVQLSWIANGKSYYKEKHIIL